MAEETTTFLAGNNRACSNGRSEENEYSGVERAGIDNGGSSKKESLCYGSGSWKELLCLQRFQAHGPTL